MTILHSHSQTQQKIRNQAATIALAVNAFLTATKLGVGWISGSIAVVSEGIHSSLDLVSAAIAFYTIRIAGVAADEDHPYGHGKFETFSSFFEAILLVVAGVWVLVEAVDHFQNPVEIHHSGIAIAVMGVSVLVSAWAYRQNRRAAEAVDSSAIRVNALHFLADVMAGIAVFVGLILMEFTGWAWIDPVVAGLVAIYIFSISFKQVMHAFHELTDVALPPQDLALVQEIFAAQKYPVLEAHDLRSRKSGSSRQLDFHLTVCKKLTVEESHQCCDEIEQAIEGRLTRSVVTVHVEPCNHHGNASCEPFCFRARGEVRP